MGRLAQVSAALVLLSTAVTSAAELGEWDDAVWVDDDHSRSAAIARCLHLDGAQGSNCDVASQDSTGECCASDCSTSDGCSNDCCDCDLTACYAPRASGIYGGAEYLLWSFEGMQTPPLAIRGEVNNNGTPNDPSDDFFDNAVVTYGGDSILTDARSGYRLKLGSWLGGGDCWAIEADYAGFEKTSESFVDGGNGTFPAVGRPFIDATTGLDSFEAVSFPGIAGSMRVDSSTRFQIAGARIRKNLFGAAQSSNSSRRIDGVAGFRWGELDEKLAINEDLETIPPTTPAGTALSVDDRFDANNTFLGGEVGFLCEWQQRRWSLEAMSLLGIGNTQQKVNIAGQTTSIDAGSAAETKVGGLYAQSTNIGEYRRDVFSVMPQIGFTGGYRVTERIRLTAGYTLFYWSRVVRSGEIIDERVNPSLTDFDSSNDNPPNDPRFAWRDNDLWAQGLNAGLDCRW